MSHFLTVVLVPRDEEDIEEAVSCLLAPYDENMSIDEYEHECHCVGSIAKKEANAQMDKEMGTWEEARESFAEREDIKALKAKRGDDSPSFSIDDPVNKLWNEEIVAPRNAREKELIAGHSMRGKPDPECGFHVGEYWEKQVKNGKLDASKLGQRFDDGCGCGGTGTYMSTYNPDSKWDWWQIGGRWTGAISPEDYDPASDPDNIEKCELCAGTGDRPGWVYYDKEGKRQFKDDWAKKCNGCNGCHGKGTKAKWPTEWKSFEGDIQFVSKMKRDNIFALLTPDGAWHEKGDMGWWGMVLNEKEKGDWDLHVSQVLHKYCDHVAVACDLHI